MTSHSILSQTWRYDKQIRIALFIIQAVQIAYYLMYMLNMTHFGPTLDDSWIHYQYSRNLALFHEISFNQGQWTTGTTSLLWNLILALGIKAGIPVVQFSVAVGVLLYFVLAQQAYTLFRSLWQNDWKPAFAALLLILTGNVAWFSLSGMETMLFLTLGLWWIAAFKERKYLMAGMISGLLVLTRIEGLIFILMGIFFSFWNLGFKRGIKAALLQIALCLPVIAPSILLNLSVVGEIYPNTMAGKKWLYNLPAGMINTNLFKTFSFVIAWIATFFQTNWFPEVFDRPFTLQYLFIRAITGGRKAVSLPEFNLEPHPLLLQLFVILVSIVLFVILFSGAFMTILRAFKDFLRKEELKRWHYLVFWFIGFNLIYLVLMPQRGHGGRYQAVNFILAALFIAQGVGANFTGKKLSSLVRKFVLIPSILLVYFISAASWADLYASSVRHVNNVHRAAGEWLHDNITPGTKIAVFDVGAIKYFSGLPVIDIAGLTDSEALECLIQNRGIELMRDKGCEYIAMIEEYNWRGDGSGDTDGLKSPSYERVGFFETLGKELELEPVKRFAISREHYFHHWTALKTHSPIIGVYKIVWLDQNQDSGESAGWHKD